MFDNRYHFDTIHIQMASAWPSYGGEYIEKRLEHVFNRFSYCFK